MLLFVVFLGLYLVSGAAVGSGDTLPARYLPWSLLTGGTFSLDAFPALYGADAARTYPSVEATPYYLQRHGRHHFSAYSPGPAVLALPVYLLPVLAGVRPDAAWASWLEKLSASTITALSGVFLFLALRRLTTPGWALGIAAIYALGTSSLSVSSQGLWQHGPGQLFVALLVWVVTGDLHRRRTLVLVGFAMAGAGAMRATNVLLVLPLALWLVWQRPRGIAWLALGAAPPMGGLLAYSLGCLGGIMGSERSTTAPLWAYFVQTPLFDGLAGVLASPGRGLFVYSPVLLFSIVGMVLVWRDGLPVMRALSVGPVLLVLVVSKWIVWWGGHTWGPRLVADALPILCVLLAPASRWAARGRVLTGAFVLLGALSVASHALGAFFYDGSWDVSRSPAQLWSWRHGPLAYYGRIALEPLANRLLPLGHFPTSVEAPELLRATVRVGHVPAEVFPGQRMLLALTVTNAGDATWLAHASGDRGAVRIGWRWRRGAGVIMEGRIALPRHVPPGQTVHVEARVSAPEASGDYVLDLEMVSELVTWFSAPGTPPLRHAVTVRPWDLSRLLSGSRLPRRGPIIAAVMTDRESYEPGEALRLSVTLRNRSEPNWLNVLLLLQGPERTLSYDGQALTTDVPGAWRPWIAGLPLPARVDGRFTLTVPPRPEGSYAWHVVVLDAESGQLVAAGTTGFRIAARAALGKP